VARGTVKRFNEEKGYGFLAPDEGARTCSSTTLP
jgi:cold shock CspA family protein